MNIHIGFDPATEKIGCCPIMEDGEPLPRNRIENKVAWRLFESSDIHAQIRLKAKGHARLSQERLDDRIDILRECIRYYLFNELPMYFRELNITGWRILSFAIENPASGGVLYYMKGESRHDAGFVLGRSYQVIRDQLTLWMDAQGISVPIYASKAAQSSSEIGVAANAPKLVRNARCAVLTGGRYDPNVAETVVGGSLHGANPDVLDAYAAVQYGRGQYIAEQLLQRTRRGNDHAGVTHPPNGGHDANTTATHSDLRDTDARSKIVLGRGRPTQAIKREGRTRSRTKTQDA